MSSGCRIHSSASWTTATARSSVPARVARSPHARWDRRDPACPLIGPTPRVFGTVRGHGQVGAASFAALTDAGVALCGE